MINYNYGKKLPLRDIPRGDMTATEQIIDNTDIPLRRTSDGLPRGAPIYKARGLNGALTRFGMVYDTK